MSSVDRPEKPSVSRAELLPPTKENLAKVARLLEETFVKDPIDAFTFSRVPASRLAKTRRQWYKSHVKASAMNGAEIYGIPTPDGDDLAGVVVWLPPGKDLDHWTTLLQSGLWKIPLHLRTRGMYNMYSKFLIPVDHVRDRHVGSRPYWYPCWMGIRPEHAGAGAARALAATRTPGLMEASNMSTPTATCSPATSSAESGQSRQGKKKQKEPAYWAEATSKRARDIYERFGWKHVDTVVVGKGIVDEKGSKCKGGSGVPLYCVMYQGADSPPRDA